MKENYPNKIYYSISEVADILEESPTLVRFWSNKFPSIIKPERNKKGNRQFTAKDVENFKLIYHLVKECGLKLEGAEKRLKENATEEQKKFNAVQRLKEVKRLLREISNSITPDESRGSFDTTPDFPTINDYNG